MKRVIFASALFLAGALFSSSQEQKQAEEESKQLKGFAWLKQFEGEWETAFEGTMKCKVIGEKWVVSEISFPTGLYSVQTLGYDTEKKAFVGTWVDASASHIWHYTGRLDATGKKLILEAEGPDFSDPTKTSRYRDTYDFKSETEIAVESLKQDAQKEWKVFTQSKMTRKKATREKSAD